MRGSENNDPFTVKDRKLVTETNHAGGILGGITNGMPLVFRLAVKPTPSIAKQQQTVSQQVEDQRLANQELQEAIDNSDDPETLERVARERGYVKQGETLYSDVAG